MQNTMGNEVLSHSKGRSKGRLLSWPLVTSDIDQANFPKGCAQKSTRLKGTVINKKADSPSRIMKLCSLASWRTSLRLSRVADAPVGLHPY